MTYRGAVEDDRRTGKDELVTVRQRTTRGRSWPAVAAVLGVLAAAVPASAAPRSVETTVHERVLARSAEPSTRVQEPGGSDDDVQAEYDEVLGAEQQLLDELARLSAERERVAAELQRLELEAATRQNELADARAALASALREEADQTAARERADRDVARVRERLRRQAVATFVNGGEGNDVLSAILRAETVSEADIALMYSRAVVTDTDELLRDLKEAQARRVRAQRAATVARATAERRRNEIQTLTDAAVAARDRQKQLATDLDVNSWNETLKLQEIQARKVVVEVRITAMNHASDGVQQLLAAVQADQPDYKPGVLVITTPIPGYRIGSKFGLRHHPILGITRLHAGGDIGAPTGTPIHAPADGIVVFAGERGGYGNCVVIDHGNSLGTLYGHQSRLNVKAGDVVKRGDVIGFVGSTGLSTGPHLHFETRIKGVPVDPETIVDWLAEVDYGDNQPGG
ncbi:MAG: peptidoglycan DD-metalloendopeptidase family protein [Acidimicrobiales bacterium]|nr:peptidoglycan DD-metalloendopeptidase family protein [Acidimicrobiales bacterium]